MQSKLSTRGLAKRYGTIDALLPTDLDVRPGELLTLLGPSGSGKTTLLQMLAGLVEPTGGQLFIDGKDATDLPAGERGIGMVFQSYALFPHMTVAENVGYPLRMRRRKTAEIATEVARALSMVKMDAFGARYPRELSGGQQQRIALASCFVYRPEIILLDEPLGALDKNLREHMQAEIRSLHRELGATFIYVTHDQDEALSLSDRVCLMNDARIEQIGSPRELYDRPVSRLAANFIGHSNLLDGRVESGGFVWRDRRLVVADGGAASLPAASLMVRPEVVRVVPAEQGVLQGTVRDLVFQGSDIKLVAQLPGGEEFSARMSCQAPHPQVGEAVGLAWDPQHAVVLSR